MMDSIFKFIIDLIGQTRGNRLIVLTYHRIFLEPDKMHPNEVDVAKFTWQMVLLKRFFNVLSLADALDHLQNNSLPPRAVCLTFDDGYASCYTEVLPILRRFNFSASFFIVSNALNQHGMWNDWIIETVRSISTNKLDLRHLGLEVYTLDDKAKVALKIVEAVKYLPIQKRTKICEKIGHLCETRFSALMLTTEQLLELHHQGMDIGGHTQNHPILKNLSLAEAKREICLNKQDLEKILNTPIHFFAYPNGKLADDFLVEHAHLVKDCGYQAALTTEKACIDQFSDQWQLPRISPWDNSSWRFMLSMLSRYFCR